MDTTDTPGIMDTLTDTVTDTTEENDLPMLSQKQMQMPKLNLGTDTDTADMVMADMVDMVMVDTVDMVDTDT
jgi:hypothetical protein